MSVAENSVILVGLNIVGTNLYEAIVLRNIPVRLWSTCLRRFILKSPARKTLPLDFPFPVSRLHVQPRVSWVLVLLGIFFQPFPAFWILQFLIARRWLLLARLLRMPSAHHSRILSRSRPCSIFDTKMPFWNLVVFLH